MRRRVPKFVDVISPLLREQELSPCCSRSLTESYGLFQCDECRRVYKKPNPETEQMRKAFDR